MDAQVLEADNSRAADAPWSTLISTEVWLSAAVEKISLLEVGRVVLRVMSLVITPPRVSSPKESGVTSSSTMSRTSPAQRHLFKNAVQQLQATGHGTHCRRTLSAGTQASKGCPTNLLQVWYMVLERGTSMEHCCSCC